MEKNVKKNAYTHTHIYMYITESLFCTAEINTTLSFNYASVKNRFKKRYI